MQSEHDKIPCTLRIEVVRMHRSHSPTMTRSAASDAALGVACRAGGVALAGVVGLGLAAFGRAGAQGRAGVQTPFGRAPLSFADIVERVKPAVVSISRHQRGAQGRRQQAPRRQPEGRQPEGFLPDLPDDHPLNEFFKNLPKEWRGQPQPAAAAPGAGLGLRHLGRRLHRDQQPRRRRRHQDQGQLRRSGRSSTPSSSAPTRAPISRC